MLTYKALYGLGFCYLSERLSFKSFSSTTCTSQTLMLRVATPKEAQKASTRNWGFLVVAAPFWNALPVEEQLVPTLLSFHKQIKT